MSENLCENLLENLREKGVKKKTVVEQSDGTLFHTIFAPRIFGNFDPETQEKTPLQTSCKLPLGQCFFSYVFRAPGGGTKGE